MTRLIPNLRQVRRALASPINGEAVADRRVDAAPQHDDVDLYNRHFYERCWQAASLMAMPGVEIPSGPKGLQVEVGCGLRPRLPLADALFVDVSPTACKKLQRAGARVIRGSIDALPLVSGAVSQIYLFDVLEHVSDDAAVARELARVCAVGAWLVLSTPLHGNRWHEFDRVVGHARRYEPRALVDLFSASGFRLESFAPFGLRPRNALLTWLGAYYMMHWPRLAFRFQERVLRFTRRRAQPTLLRPAGVEEFLAQVAGADGAVTAWRAVPG